MYTVPKGRTALLDAIYLGMAKMRQAKQQRKALLIISDGGDNRSRYTENEIKSMVKEADVQIYAIGIFDQSSAQRRGTIRTTVAVRGDRHYGRANLHGRQSESVEPMLRRRSAWSCATSMCSAIVLPSRRTMASGARCG